MKQSTQTKQNGNKVSRWFSLIAASTCLAILAASCSESSLSPSESDTRTSALENIESKAKGSNTQSYEFNGPVFDIAATPDGGILVAETNFPSSGSESTVKKITKRGVQTVAKIETVPGSPINGLAALGSKNFFAAAGGQDLAVGAKIYQVTPGGQRLVGDIKSFEINIDPDATEGLQWKDLQCEEDPTQGFTAGPQSNPYHLKAVSGSEVLVADAAGNSLLSVKKNGDIDWVAVFTPPLDDKEEFRIFRPAIGDTSITCYVQPVPTSVDIGPDGAMYVGELTGVTPADLEAPGPTTGLSRIWRIEKGSSNVICPSDDCKVLVDGLTSVIDLEFGPDGYLYVVEYDENNWFQATAFGKSAGGNVKRCDVTSGTCEIIEDGDVLFAAITFDKRDNLWLLESNLVAPTVRKLNIP
jgi:hypothetical protein